MYSCDPIIGENCVVNFLLIMLLTLPAGIVFAFFPMSVIKVMMRWPKFIFPKLFNEQDISPRSREAMYLMEQDEELYKQKFAGLLLWLRLSGVVALIIFLAGLLMAMGYLRQEYW